MYARPVAGRPRSSGSAAGAAAAMPAVRDAALLAPPWRALAGVPFIHPAVDALLVGGGLSLLAAAFLAADRAGRPVVDAGLLPWIVLFSNSAHFAASSVRLYTKPGAARAMPGVSVGLPIAAAALFGIGLAWPGRIAPALQTLYLAWSPYHYAAQAYGIAVIYAHRAGRRLGEGDRRLLKTIALLPFLYMLARLLESRAPSALAAFLPAAGAPDRGLGGLLMAAGLVAPAAWFVALWRRDRRPLPLLTFLPILSNGVWFFILDPLDAFFWATVFHGLQYLALVLVFHARDGAAPGAGRGELLARALRFYALSLGVGYALFILWPAAAVALGGDAGDSRLLAVALVNLHHFLVDARIWRLRGGDRNLRVVEAAEGVVA